MSRRRLPLLIGLALVGLAASAVVVQLRKPPAWLMRAEDALEAGNNAQALRIARARLDDEPRDRRASRIAARALTDLGEPLAAERHYRNAQPLDQAESRARAAGLIAIGRNARAIEVLEAHLERWPEDPEALWQLAALWMAEGRWERAKPWAKRLADRPKPEDAIRGHTVLGFAHHQARRYEEAITSLERVLELDPDLTRLPLPESAFWRVLATDLIAYGRAAEARAYLEPVVANPPEADPQLLALLGTCAFDEGRVAEAEQAWRTALEREPRIYEARLGLGRLALGRSDWADAATHFEIAAEQRPEAPEPLEGLARARLGLGDTAEAERLAQAARRMRDQAAGHLSERDQPPPDPDAIAGRPPAS